MIARVPILTIVLTISLNAASGGEKSLKNPDAWFTGAEGRRSLECILSWQTEAGGWPKNENTTGEEYTGNLSDLRSTFDNGATIDELRVLARGFQLTKDIRYKYAYVRGLRLIFEAQYSNGGFPQYFPLRKGYYSHITFNDNSMVRILELLHDVASSEDYHFLDEFQRAAARSAYDKGIACILKCQVKVNGRLTVWCAQHDSHTLKPVKARSYELPSLSGGESAGILRLLMDVDDPTPEVIRAIKAGVSWYEASKIEGYRYERKDGDSALIKDPEAASLWARFYELDTNRPFFSDRDGVKKYDVQEIGEERRNGYSWFSAAGSNVARDYAKWKLRIRL